MIIRGESSELLIQINKISYDFIYEWGSSSKDEGKFTIFADINDTRRDSVYIVAHGIFNGLLNIGGGLYTSEDALKIFIEAYQFPSNIKTVYLVSCYNGFTKPAKVGDVQLVPLINDVYNAILIGCVHYKTDEGDKFYATVETDPEKVQIQLLAYGEKVFF